MVYILWAMQCLLSFWCPEITKRYVITSYSIHYTKLYDTTPVQELLNAGRRLGLPSVMALSLGMMIRYLFLFATMFTQIHHSLQGRNFDPWAKNLPYRYRIRTLGYAMGVLFLRAYEQGVV